MSAEGERSLSKTLAQARLFIRKSYINIDPDLPALLGVLEARGASECWHKHSTFFEHLHSVYRILKLWDVPDSVARCGLFHSSYSNSYVNLAIFEPDVDRRKVRDLIGKDAEELVHWFCIVPRQQMIYDHLLSKFTDEDLMTGLQDSKNSSISPNGVLGKAAQDINGKLHNLTKRTPLLPAEGLVVKHIRTGEDLLVPRRLIAVFLILTIADFSDQWYSWQDSMFDNSGGNMDFSGKNRTSLWPGDGKPGLWITSVSRMGLLLNRIIKDEEEYEAEERRQCRGEGLLERPFGHIEIRAPPVLNRCTKILSASDQVESLKLYWEALSPKDDEQRYVTAKSCLIKALKHNPYIAEPHILLAQIFLEEGMWEEARRESVQGLELLLDWGTPWDKRITWEGWVAWARVLEMNAKDKTWAQDGWGMINLGLVK